MLQAFIGSIKAYQVLNSGKRLLISGKAKLQPQKFSHHSLKNDEKSRQKFLFGTSITTRSLRPRL